MSERKWCDVCGVFDCHCVVDTLRAHIAQLKEALENYGMHIPMCSGEPCTCGLNAALSTPPSEWLEQKKQEWLEAAQHSICSYCGARTERNSDAWEDFQSRIKDHMISCDKRPELQLLSVLVWADDNYAIRKSDAPEEFKTVIDTAEKWLEEQRRLAKAEELEIAAVAVKAQWERRCGWDKHGMGETFAEMLRQSAAELRGGK